MLRAHGMGVGGSAAARPDLRFPLLVLAVWGSLAAKDWARFGWQHNAQSVAGWLLSEWAGGAGGGPAGVPHASAVGCSRLACVVDPQGHVAAPKRPPMPTSAAACTPAG